MERYSAMHMRYRMHLAARMRACFTARPIHRDCHTYAMRAQVSFSTLPDFDFA